MRITSVIARYLLGLLFTVFGLNGFFHFIHKAPPTNPMALQFFRSRQRLALCGLLLRGPGCWRAATSFRVFCAASTDTPRG